MELIVGNSQEEEFYRVIERIKKLHTNPKSNILVLFRRNWQKKGYKFLFFEGLRNENIQWEELGDFSDRFGRILIGTMHGTKGLEADTVIIPQVDQYNSDSDRQLLYVGITRAKKTLILSASRITNLVQTYQSYTSQLG